MLAGRERGGKSRESSTADGDGIVTLSANSLFMRDFHLIYMGQRSASEHDAAPHTATARVQIYPTHETHTARRDFTHLNRVRQADQPEITGLDR